MKTVAIIGPTASGKTDLAHTLARQSGAVVLSCDSLSVFKTIDIASAKPAPDERAGIDYFGLDLVDPCGRFGAEEFAAEFLRAGAFCEAQNRPLIIVGGTGFYLKVLLDGLSPIPEIPRAVADRVAALLEDPAAAHAQLARLDPVYAGRIHSTDRYRIEKGLLIALASGEAPSIWFAAHPPKPLLQNAAVFEVEWPVEILRGRIGLRTQKMLSSGLIDEVARLESLCPRNAQAMRSIGIAEVLDYFDGKVDKSELQTLIATHTAQFAKRQRTFNRGQFDTLITLPPESLAAQARIFLNP